MDKEIEPLIKAWMLAELAETNVELTPLQLEFLIDSIDGLKAENTRLRKMLKNIEYVYYGVLAYCPCCRARKDKEHTDSCELKAILEGETDG